MMQPSIMGQGGTLFTPATSGGSRHRPNNIANNTTNNPSERYARIDATPLQRMANDRGDSWVEVSSQPSDSYTSSSSSTENIVITDGLRIQNQSKRRAARKARREAAARACQENGTRQDRMNKPPIHHQSSSDDLDEHEADDISDTNLDSIGSSIADLPSLSEGFDDEGESSTGGESSEDEAETSKGKQTSSRDNNRAVPSHSRMTTAFASSSSRPAQPARLHSFSRAPPQPDHDAALRASLSTLLSCAAATRALPKPRSEHAGRSNLAPPSGGPHIQTLTLMTDEQREAMMDFMASTPATHHLGKQDQDNTSSAPKTVSSPAALKSRRTSVTEPIPETQPEQRKSAQHRKHKSSSTNKGLSSVLPFTPSNVTYVTLAVSAAAVLLVSAISFSAGYHIGKEVGRGELLNLGNEGHEFVRRAASETMSRAGGRIVLGSGMSGNLRSISVR